MKIHVVKISWRTSIHYAFLVHETHNAWKKNPKIILLALMELVNLIMMENLPMLSSYVCIKMHAVLCVWMILCGVRENEIEKKEKSWSLNMPWRTYEGEISQQSRRFLKFSSAYFPQQRKTFKQIEQRSTTKTETYTS